jgi:hypothetical protein
MAVNSERIHIKILGTETMLWQLWNNKEVFSLNNICSSCGRTSTHTHCFYLWPKQFLTISNNFNRILWTYIMYISSSIYFKDQPWTWGRPDVGWNMQLYTINRIRLCLDRYRFHFCTNNNTTGWHSLKYLDLLSTQFMLTQIGIKFFFTLAVKGKGKAFP